MRTNQQKGFVVLLLLAIVAAIAILFAMNIRTTLVAHRLTRVANAERLMRIEAQNGMYYLVDFGNARNASQSGTLFKYADTNMDKELVFCANGAASYTGKTYSFNPTTSAQVYWKSGDTTPTIAGTTSSFCRPTVSTSPYSNAFKNVMTQVSIRETQYNLSTVTGNSSDSGKKLYIATSISFMPSLIPSETALSDVETCLTTKMNVYYVPSNISPSDSGKQTVSDCLTALHVPHVTLRRYTWSTT